MKRDGLNEIVGVRWVNILLRGKSCNMVSQALAHCPLRRRERKVFVFSDVGLASEVELRLWRRIAGAWSRRGIPRIAWEGARLWWWFVQRRKSILVLLA